MEGFTQKQAVDLEDSNPILIRNQPIIKGDTHALNWIVTVRKGGQPIDLSKAEIALYCARALDEDKDESGGTTYSDAAGTSDGVVTAQLPQDAANIPGMVGCTIRATLDGVSVTLARMSVMAIDPIGSDIIDEGKRIPNLDEVLAAVARCESAAAEAEGAAKAALASASNADDKANLANTAARAATKSAKTADASAEAADAATKSANAAAKKIDDMTVTATGLAPGEAPTAVLTDEDGHYNLALGLTKGDTGDSGVYMGEEEPTDPDVNVWIKPSGMPSGVIDNVAREEIAELSARQNILIGAETGTTVSVTDAFAAPLCGLTIYGRSTQDGTPTTDAPVPIVSAGDGGTITVTIGDGADERQTITLQTPNGLPGIPVKSGGNYTDENGQQWICDEIDLTRGVRVQRVGSCTLKNITIHGFDNLANNYRITGATEIEKKASGTVYSLLCTDYENNQVDQWAWPEKNNRISWSGDPYRQLRVYDERDQAEIIESLNSGNVRVDYVLGDPVETPLTDAEIAAYKALTTYAPTTVAQVTDDAGLRLSYQRDVNLVIRNLEDAIASMTNN